MRTQNDSTDFLYWIGFTQNANIRLTEMKIDIKKIDEGRFVIREENNKEYVDQLAASLKKDGQWNPIIVRPKPDGRYEIIAGHYRLKAAKKAGFKDIEATVRDLPNDEADVLSLKTNLIRLEMSPREQGQVINKMMEAYGWNQSETAKRLNVSPDWVSQRVRVALALHDKVAKALDAGKINFSVAVVIAAVEVSRQPEFLKIIIEDKITANAEAWTLRKFFLNDTILTIGYQGYTSETFIEKLKENKIELVMDIRYSSESQYKPDFNGPILKRELERNDIQYVHRSEFGLPYEIQNPYKDGGLGYDCVKQWYSWHIAANADFNGFINELKSGTSALLCMEKFAKPKGNQKYSCHRDILADMILEYEPKEKLLMFNNRVDL